MGLLCFDPVSGESGGRAAACSFPFETVQLSPERGAYSFFMEAVPKLGVIYKV
jgi:hypothetical protein